MTMKYFAKNGSGEFPFTVNKADGSATSISSTTVFVRESGDDSPAGNVFTAGTSLQQLETYAGAYVAKVQTTDGQYIAGNVYFVYVNGTVETLTATRCVGEFTLSALADIETFKNADNQLGFITVTGSPTVTSIPTSSLELGDGTTVTVVANQFDGYWLAIGAEICKISSHTTGASPTFTISTDEGERLYAAPSSGDKIPIIGRTA